jgi:hypothetical protein
MNKEIDNKQTNNTKTTNKQTYTNSARLMSAVIHTNPRENPIFVDESTHNATKSKFSFSSSIEIHVKGKTEALCVYVPIKPSHKHEKISEAATYIIGRDEEISVLCLFVCLLRVFVCFWFLLCF